MGGLLKMVREWAARLEHATNHSPNRGLRLLERTIAVSRYGASELRRNRATQMAAALTYYTLFSILPTLALGLVVLQAFVNPDQQREIKETIIEWALGPLDAYGESIEGTAGGEAETVVLGISEGSNQGSNQGPVATADPAVKRAEEYHQAQQALETRVQQLLDTLERMDFRSIGLIGLLLFIYAATGLLTTVERSFGIVFGTTKGRPLHRRLPLYYTVITIGPIIILAGLVVRGQIIAALQAGTWTSWLAYLLSVASPLLTAWLVVFLMFRWIPNTRVKVGAAAIGALVTTIGLGLLVNLFGIFVSRTATSTPYGALALMPLFLFYLFLSWTILLFGLELAFAIQTLHAYESHRATPTTAVTADPAWAVPVAVEVARAFARGEMADAQAVSEKTELPLHEVERLLHALEAAHIVIEVESDKRSGYIPAGPADRIELAHVIAVVQEMGPKRPDGSGNDPAFRTMHELHEAERAAARGRTLADLVAQADGKAI